MSTITYYATDAQGIYTSTLSLDAYGPLPPGSVLPPPETAGTEVARWLGNRWEILPERPAPPTPETPMPDTRITRLAFRNRFTTPEKGALEIAALDDPAAPMPARLQAATLRAYLADLAAATFIDLQRPDTRAGVQMLEDAGLLAEGRALEILDDPIQPEERPL